MIINLLLIANGFISVKKKTKTKIQQPCSAALSQQNQRRNSESARRRNDDDDDAGDATTTAVRESKVDARNV